MRITPYVCTVLRALLQGEDATVYGFALVKSADLQDGTAYAILTRLVTHGWATRAYEQAPGRIERGHPPRRVYTLTPHGRQQALHALAQHDQPTPAPPPHAG